MAFSVYKKIYYPHNWYGAARPYSAMALIDAYAKQKADPSKVNAMFLAYSV